MTWLIDTLVWTGALIALVLLVRRPVARWFGPVTAYSLWLLPLLRLILPPLVLPAPVQEAQPVSMTADEIAAIMQSAHAAESMPAPVPETVALLPDLSTLLLGLWLAGGIVYIALRLIAYRQLRTVLLDGARTVGVAGRVRLLETPATRSPLAFGVIDKVVALPPGFMASPDRTARDLALEHELAHHRSNDLAANFAALPLFAMHWFNPLSWLGWTAMRRDQEAACDARVVAGRGRDERARYAAVIAGAAAAPRAALAAPMACPVLGDKSIVQRLRNLAMSDLSQRRRRTGGLLVGLGALMLPLTASVTYAQMAPGEPVAPPASPPAPDAPLPPEAPTPPLPPEAPIVHVERIEVDGEKKRERIVIVSRTPGGEEDRDVIELHTGDLKGFAPDSPEFEIHMKKLGERLGKLDKEIEGRVLVDAKRIKQITEDAQRAALAGSRIAMLAPRVEMNCDGPDGMSETRDKDGRMVMRFCKARVMDRAVVGLRGARAAIAANDDMTAESRAEVLATLDREIARLEAED